VDPSDGDNNQLVIGYHNGVVRYYNDALSGEIRWQQQLSSMYTVEGFQFLLNKQKAITWVDNQVEMWDLETGSKETEFRGHTKKVSQACICEDSAEDILFTSSSDKTIKRWNLHTGEVTEEFRGHTAGVTCFKVISANMFVSGSTDKTIKVWDARIGARKDSVLTLKGHVGPVRCLQASNNKLLSGGDDNSIRMWDLTMVNQQSVQHFQMHDFPVLSLDFTNSTLVSGASDGQIKIWTFT
jgi:WD40 repeat protein